MSEHTEGPWMIGEPGWLSKGCYSLVNPKGNVIAVQILVKEDAELMRAAPDLLAACEEALVTMRAIQGGRKASIGAIANTYTPQLAVRRIDAEAEHLNTIIAKVKGEA